MAYAQRCQVELESSTSASEHLQRHMPLVVAACSLEWLKALFLGCSPVFTLNAFRSRSGPKIRVDHQVRNALPVIFTLRIYIFSYILLFFLCGADWGSLIHKGYSDAKTRRLQVCVIRFTSFTEFVLFIFTLTCKLCLYYVNARRM